MSGNILCLAWTCELSLLLSYAWFLVSVQVPNNIDPVVDSGGILTGEHRSPRGCAIGLGVGVGKAQALVGDFLNIGSDEGTGMSTHRDLCGTDLVPAQVINQVYNEIGLFVGKAKGRGQASDYKDQRM